MQISKEELRDMAKYSVEGYCEKIINNYMMLYDKENPTRDDVFLKELAGAIIGISIVLEVYNRDGQIHPDYLNEKLLRSKSLIETTIKYFKLKGEEDEN